MEDKIKRKVEVLVIGGGASGMMAAGRAGELRACQKHSESASKAQNVPSPRPSQASAKKNFEHSAKTKVPSACSCGREVLLLEKNRELGKKLKITGGGRCNIANGEEDVKKLLSFYGKADKFLHSPFSVFGLAETLEFFKNKNLEVKEEDRKRLFPKSEKAMDVFLVLEKYLKDNNVEVLLDSPVERISIKKGRIEEVETATHIIYPNKVILSTGGLSHPETGSTGDGFNWLKELGHRVEEPTPDIVPLSTKEVWSKKISGVALDDIKISFYCDGKKEFVQKGRLLCTHFGISGPTVLNSSSKVRDLLYKGQVTARVDLYPSLDIGSLEKKFISVFDGNKNKILKNVLPDLLPPGFMPAFRKIFPTLDLNTKVHSFKKEERKQVVIKLKALELSVSGLMGFDRAVVSDGGVILSEINTKTMQSRKCDNLFVTGDLLNISRPSGGYSLQLCWTTGFIAGSNV